MQAAELSNNVEALLVAVKATNDFEQEMAKRFGGGGSGDSVADEVRVMHLAHASTLFVLGWCLMTMVCQGMDLSLAMAAFSSCDLNASGNFC